MTGAIGFLVFLALIVWVGVRLGRRVATVNQQINADIRRLNLTPAAPVVAAGVCPAGVSAAPPTSAPGRATPPST